MHLFYRNGPDHFFPIFALVMLFLLAIMPFPLAGGTVTDSVKSRSKGVAYPADYKPWNPEQREYRDGDISLLLACRSFSQGEVVYWELVRQRDSVVSVQSVAFNGKTLRYSSFPWGYRGFFAINPDARPGKYLFRLVYRDGDGKEYAEIHIEVHDAGFPFARTPMDLGKYSDVDYQEKPENLEFIRVCAEKKKKAFATLGPDLITAGLAHPRDRHYITSPFWARRVYMQYRYRKGKKVKLPNRIKTHRGIDFRGTTGEPVFAISGGTVNLGETLFYEGNMVILDHGNRIFSYYMHMDGITVSPGERVKAGELIGRVGSTGISTASHLHVSLMIEGVQVDPLSMLFLPVRE